MTRYHWLEVTRKQNISASILEYIEAFKSHFKSLCLDLQPNKTEILNIRGDSGTILVEYIEVKPKKTATFLGYKMKKSMISANHIEELVRKVNLLACQIRKFTKLSILQKRHL